VKWERVVSLNVRRLVDVPGFECREEQEAFLFPDKPRSAMGPIEPLFNQYQGSFPDVNQPASDVDCLLFLILENSWPAQHG